MRASARPAARKKAAVRMSRARRMAGTSRKLTPLIVQWNRQSVGLISGAGPARLGAATVLSRGQDCPRSHGGRRPKPLELRGDSRGTPLAQPRGTGVISMFSRPLAFILLALGCVTAAAGGAYVATRQNAAQPAPIATASSAGHVGGSRFRDAAPTAQPVAETEAAVTSVKPEVPAKTATSDTPARVAAAPKSSPEPAPSRRRAADAPAAPAATRALRSRAAPRAGERRPCRAAGRAAARAGRRAAACSRCRNRRVRSSRSPKPPRVPQFEESSCRPRRSSACSSSPRCRPSGRGSRIASMRASRVTCWPRGAWRFRPDRACSARSRSVERGGKVKERGPSRRPLPHADSHATAARCRCRRKRSTAKGNHPPATARRRSAWPPSAARFSAASSAAGRGRDCRRRHRRRRAARPPSWRATVTPRRCAAGEIVTARLSSPATITVARRE